MNYCCDPVVKVIADSTFNGSRLTSIEVEYWRPIHPEVMTHRVFSRCFSSSRAKPVNSSLTSLSQSIWGPKHWTLDCKGMQAKEEVTNPDIIKTLQSAWVNQANVCCLFAHAMDNNAKLHKQVVNRILEPYTSIKGVITATEWDNFFNLRCAKDAQPEMQDLANAIKEAINSSEPKELKEGMWHLPYISEEDLEEYGVCDDIIMASAARCARVSYKAFDGTTSIMKDKELFVKLAEKKHYSPLEMVAQAGNATDKYKSNFNNNWIQLRKIIENNDEIRSNV